MKHKAAISNLLFVGVVAAIVAFLLWRTDAERIVREVQTKVEEPYAVMAIVPDSLAQHPIPHTSNWGLFYSLKMKKGVTCDEIRVQRVVQRIADPGPLANNTDIFAEIVDQASGEQIVDGLYVRMHGPLGPGDYLLVLISTCLVIAEDGVRVPLLGKAETHLCFRVPEGVEGAFVEEPFQPISENCSRELSHVKLSPWPYRLAHGR